MTNKYTSKIRRIGFRNLANIEMIVKGKRRHYLIRSLDDFWVNLKEKDTFESKMEELRRLYPKLQIYKTVKGYLVTSSVLGLTSL